MMGEGPELDAKLVHMEQQVVQDQLDNLRAADPAAYADAIQQVNDLRNSNAGIAANALSALSGLVLPADTAYAQVLAGAGEGLGRDIIFSNQKDREAIGNAVVQHVRKTGGCDVAGDKIHGCRQ